MRVALGWRPVRLVLCLVGALFLQHCTTARAQVADSIDFVSMLEMDTTWTRSLGLGKLTKAEKESLNRLLHTNFQLGLDFGSKRDSLADHRGPVPTMPDVNSAFDNKDHAYLSKIEKDNDDVFQLENGAVVQISSGFLGHVGFRKKVVLFRTSRNWRIWIEGKRAYKCEVLKLPDYGNQHDVELLTLSESRAGGSILLTFDGSVFEVNSLYRFNTVLWLSTADLLLIDDYQMINLDTGDEMIEVVRIR